MKADAIRDQVSKNMARHGFVVADLRVQPDPFNGWRLWLESEAFRGMSTQGRRDLVLDGLADEHFEWIDLITPEEKSWAGVAPRDSDLEDLPLWPEALARARTVTTPIDARFLSDLDEDLPPPLICTFYSLKGGVGRTTALGYTALILANQGFKVVCVDMDLEAPGLTSVFGREHEIKADMGVVHILASLDRGEAVDLRDHLIRADDDLDLYVVPAGLPGAEYARLLRFTDPLSWYREEVNPLHQMVEQLRHLTLNPDLILFDARTGFDALNAPFLFELSDLAVIAFFPHPQARRGTGELVRALLASTTLREAGGRRLTPMPRFLETFVETAVVVKALAPDVPLILGRKGTGKTAVFRRLAEASDRSAVVALAPAPLRKDRPWVLGADGFSQVDEILKRHHADWRQVWALCAAVAIDTEARMEGAAPDKDARLAAANLAPHTELEFVDTVAQVLSIAGSGLLVADWLDRLDRAVPAPTLLLFDGLDTGFGNTEADRARRQTAIQGLFSFLTDRGEQFKNIRLKVMLREDIWQGLRFENKSHLFGRSVSLKWNEQVDFLRVVLKQAMRSQEFARFVMPQGTAMYRNAPIDQWPTEIVFKVWNLLVGERMKGGNTAFSRNWVWNRLADGNGDRIPRSLIQLFEEAVVWEREESKANAYDRSLIRPRGLIEALPKVSPRALSALKDEEFPQLEALFERLRSLRSSPVNARDIADLGDLVTLAREVGVLSVYEGTEDQVERYKVPDIYLAGLGMARKGQA